MHINTKTSLLIQILTDTILIRSIKNYLKLQKQMLNLKKCIGNRIFNKAILIISMYYFLNLTKNKL